MRDDILYEQKILLDRNQINTDISYEGLKAIDRPENSLKRGGDEYLPDIAGGRGMPRVQRAGSQYGRSPGNQLSPRRESNSANKSSQMKLPTFKPSYQYQVARFRCKLVINQTIKVKAGVVGIYRQDLLKRGLKNCQKN